MGLKEQLLLLTHSMGPILAKQKLTGKTSGGGVHLQGGSPRTAMLRSICPLPLASARRGQLNFSVKSCFLEQGGRKGCGARDWQQQDPFLHFQLPPNQQWCDPSKAFFISQIDLSFLFSSRVHWVGRGEKWMLYWQLEFSCSDVKGHNLLSWSFLSTWVMILNYIRLLLQELLHCQKTKMAVDALAEKLLLCDIIKSRDVCASKKSPIFEHC